MFNQFCRRSLRKFEKSLVEKYRRMPRLDLFFSRSRKRLVSWITLLAIISSLILLRRSFQLSTEIEKMEELLRSPPVSDSSKEDKRKIKNQIEIENLRQHYESTGELKSLNAWALNNTRLAESQILIFNRVPKVGSVMFMNLLEMLGERNHFSGYKDVQQLVAPIHLDLEDQRKMAEALSELPQPAAYSKHLCYTNFSRFGLPKPIYINMVRTPVERVISWFYYVRSPWYYIQRTQNFAEAPLPDIDWISMDFETCVLANNSECNYPEGDTALRDHRRQSIFLCGHDDECNPFNTKDAIERAKFAVENEFAVVGILEDIETSLAVFEKYIPQFFAGATEIYNENKEYFKRINQNNFKPTVSDEIRKLISPNFTQETELYEFLKKRLYTQFIAANLKNN